MYLIFDTETTGLPHNKTAPITDLNNWPRLVQIAWQLHDAKGRLLSQHSLLVKPDGFDIPFKAEQIHGISTKRALEEGNDLSKVLDLLIADLSRTSLVVGHNIEFDINILGAELIRQQRDPELLLKRNKLDTGLSAIDYCQLQGGLGGKLKMPTLLELHKKLFNKDFGDAHDASYDVAATARCYFGLLKQSVCNPFDSTPVHEIEYEEPNLEAANSTKREKIKEASYKIGDNEAVLSDRPFVHLHAHSQSSLLQATPDIKAMVSKAKAGYAAIALTDLAICMVPLSLYGRLLITISNQ